MGVGRGGDRAHFLLQGGEVNRAARLGQVSLETAGNLILPNFVDLTLDGEAQLALDGLPQVQGLN